MTLLLVLAVVGCDEAKKNAPAAEANAKAAVNKEAAYKEPAAGKVMAKPESAPVAKPGAVADDKAPATAPPKLEGKVYGGGVTLPQTVKISDLHKRVDELAGQRVRVEGTILDVCPKRGCWFEMASDEPGKHLRFKVRDGVMVFPMSAKGKHAVAEGVVRKIPLTLEQTKRVLAHEAAEYGKPFKPGEVTEPMTLVRLDGVGAVVRDGK